MYKYLLFFIFSALLFGCYAKWEELDLYAGEIDCRDSRAVIIKRAESYHAKVYIDDVSHSIQVSKAADTVVIQFDNDNKITLVSVFQIELKFFGLHRRQLAPSVLLNCLSKSVN